MGRRAGAEDDLKLDGEKNVETGYLSTEEVADLIKKLDN